MLLKQLCSFVLCGLGRLLTPDPEDGNLCFGAANPSGLRSKAQYVVSQMAHGDMWAFTETHLCSRELQSFNAGLIFAKAPVPASSWWFSSSGETHPPRLIFGDCTAIAGYGLYILD